MLEIIDAFRIQFSGRPLLLIAAALAVLLTIKRRDLARPAGSTSSDAVVGIVAVIGIVGLLTYPAIALWYARDPHFFDNAEPTMPSLAWMFHIGKPLYPALDAPERYAHIYGPVAFIVQGTALAWFGPSIWVSKVVGAAGGLAALAFVWGAVRRHASRSRSAVMTGICALVLLTFRHASFWNRPDSLQLLAVSASLYCAAIRQWTWAALLVGITSGGLWNLKFTGPLYSLPVLALLYTRFGRLPVAGSLATAAVIAMIPFALFSNVSLGHYFEWVRLSGQTGLLLSTLRQNIEWAGFLTFPLLLAHFCHPLLSSEHAPSRLPEAALLVGVCGVVVAAAKPGAGPYHLMPFVPITTYLVAQRLGDRPVTLPDPVARRGVVAFVVVALVIAIAQQTQLIATMLERRPTHDISDIVRFLDSHHGVVEMAYGRTETLSHPRPILVFRNNSYLIDQPAVREQQLQGLALPAATVDAVAQCRVNYWLVPKGEAPFSGVNSYAAVLLHPLYPDMLRQRFADTHVRGETTDYYDVWECRGGGSR
jgi:hypothetical protein